MWALWSVSKLKVWQVLFVLLPFLLWWAWSSYVGRTTKLLYDLGGKWAVVGFPLGIAGLWIYGVVMTLHLSKRADQLADAADPDDVPPPPPAELPRAIATGAVPMRRTLEPLAAAAPARPDDASGARNDAPRLLR